MATRARLPHRRSPPARDRPAAAHLSLAARAPAQGAHRLLAPRLSCRREVRRLFALKVHPCGRRASVAPGSRARDTPPPPLPDVGPGHPPFRIPVSVPTHTWFQRAPAAAITEPSSPRLALPAQRCVTSAPRLIRMNAASCSLKSRKKGAWLAGWKEFVTFDLRLVSSKAPRWV